MENSRSRSQEFGWCFSAAKLQGCRVLWDLFQIDLRVESDFFVRFQLSRLLIDLIWKSSRMWVQ